MSDSYTTGLIAKDWNAERRRRVELERGLDRLIVAVEFEIPAIRDGIEVEQRLAILARHASEAKSLLRARSEAAAVGEKL